MSKQAPSRTALIFLAIFFTATNEFDHGGIIRGNIHQKRIALVFTADEFGDGKEIISSTLRKHRVKASFFFTGRF